jgi:hypothetical protein
MFPCRPILSKLPSKRLPALILWLSFLCLSACGGFGGGDDGFELVDEDLSKFFVAPFYLSEAIQLPSEQGDVAQLFTRSLQNQLLGNFRLQTNPQAHSPLIKGSLVSYEKEVLTVRGELYNGDELLLSSDVQSQISPTDDWQKKLDFLAYQLFASLMDNLAAKQAAVGYSSYGGYYYPEYLYGGYGGYGRYPNDGDIYQPPIWPIKDPPRPSPGVISESVPKSSSQERPRNKPSSQGQESIHTPPQSQVNKTRSRDSSGVYGGSAPKSSSSARLEKAQDNQGNVGIYPAPPQAQAMPDQPKPQPQSMRAKDETRSSPEPAVLKTAPSPRPEPVEAPTPRNSPASGSSYSIAAPSSASRREAEPAPSKPMPEATPPRQERSSSESSASSSSSSSQRSSPPPPPPSPPSSPSKSSSSDDKKSDEPKGRNKK